MRMSNTTKTIIDTAVAAGSFKTLVAALTAARLVDTLSGTGPFTLFAPSDEAFAALAPGTVEDLLKPENRGRLAKMLKLHVAAGLVTGKSLIGKKLAQKSLLGEALQINGSKGITVNGASVTASDIACSNGLIHAIDAVLTPGAEAIAA